MEIGLIPDEILIKELERRSTVKSLLSLKIKEIKENDEFINLNNTLSNFGYRAFKNPPHHTPVGDKFRIIKIHGY